MTVAGLLSFGVTLNAAAVERADRELFIQAWPHVLDGEWPLSKRQERALADYPLWIDLQAARHSAQVARNELKSARAFLETAPNLAPVRRLRYRYASALARLDRWPDFFDLYQAHYGHHPDNALACTALAAAVAGNSPWPAEQIAALGRQLWLTDKSQDDACDPAFDALRNRGVIGRKEYLERYELAVAGENFSLAGYLARSIDREHTDEAQRWRAVRNDAGRMLQSADRRAALSAAQFAYATRRLALKDPALAHRLWHGHARDKAGLTDEMRAEVLRYLALAGAQDALAEVPAWFEQVPASVQDERLHAWRARAALRAEDWPGVVRAVGRMPMAQASKPRWRYWEAIALMRSGQRDAGLALLQALAEDRSYHGYLAADAVDAPYAFDHRPLPADPALVRKWSEAAAWQRVSELYQVGQADRARHELAQLTAALDKPDLLALGKLLHELEWHHEAVRLAVAGGHFDDLELRFPLAHAEQFAVHAKRRGISDTWALALARNESLFEAHARSSADALGVMQLILSTARRTAKKIGMSRPSAESLRDPEVNIALGTAHLAELMQAFGHRALATAAYNAGPHRVRRWTADTDIDPQIWIETIPYDETRDYVQSVLFADIVFQWRSNRSVDRLSRYLKPLPRQERVAESSRL